MPLNFGWRIITSLLGFRRRLETSNADKDTDLTVAAAAHPAATFFTTAFSPSTFASTVAPPTIEGGEGDGGGEEGGGGLGGGGDGGGSQRDGTLKVAEGSVAVQPAKRHDPSSLLNAAL